MLEVINSLPVRYKQKSTDHVSWESLRTKFYNTETAAQDAVKDLANGLVDYFRGR